MNRQTLGFDQRIADWLEDDPSIAPPDVMATVTAALPSIPQARRGTLARWRFPNMPALSRATGIAAVALLAVVGAGGLLVLNAMAPGGPGGPGTPAPPTSAPTLTPAPSAGVQGVKGWPDNSGSNEPGLYSWDGATCAREPCLMGVLHNHASDDVRISIERITEPSIPDGRGMPATIAGHRGLYLRVDQQLEEWNVDFDGTLLKISISAERDPSQFDVDEAHSIIESLVYEQRDTPLGFRLVFRLPSSQWDSPF